MKQSQINRAYQTLSRMATMQLPVRVAYNLCMFIKRLEPAYNCEMELERKLIEKYGGVIQEDGSLMFLPLNNSEDEIENAKQRVREFSAEIAELGNAEAPIEIDAIPIPYDALDGQTLTATDISCLDGFVVFE